MAKKSENIDDQVKFELSLFDEAQEVLDLPSILDEAGFNSPKVPLRDVCDRLILINWMSRFESSKAPGKHAYHCVCTDEENGYKFQTVIGNARGVELLDAAYDKGFRSAIRIRFAYNEGGRYGGFYTVY